jgi:hypothetical protein
LEERLAALRRGKGATPDGEGAKAKKRVGSSSSSSGSSSSSSSKKAGEYQVVVLSGVVGSAVLPARNGQGADQVVCLTSMCGKGASLTVLRRVRPCCAEYDFTNETLHWEGGPAAGDLAFNVALGATLVALPLTIGAAARSAFVKYRFTDKRVSVKTDAPWESECLFLGRFPAVLQ